MKGPDERSSGKICGTRKRTEPEVSLTIDLNEIRIPNTFLILKRCNT